MRKQLSLMLLALSLIVASCKKNLGGESEELKPISGTFLLSEITYSGSEWMKLSYNLKTLTVIEYSLYRDEIIFDASGKIQSSTMLLKSDNSVFRSNKFYYTSDNRIQRIEHYGNNPSRPSEETTYTYDAIGRVRTITMTVGTAKRAATTYEYDGNGNVILFVREDFRDNRAYKTIKWMPSQFDNKRNPLIELPKFEYMLSFYYQSEYDRLGTPILPGKNNPIKGVGTNTYNGDIVSGSITSNIIYNANGYPTENKYSHLVGGSLNVTYGYSYKIID